MNFCRSCRAIIRPRLGLPACEAEIARQDEDRLQREAIDLLALIVLRSERGDSGEADAVEVDARALSALHPALSVRVARLVLEQVAPGRFVASITSSDCLSSRVTRAGTER